MGTQSVWGKKVDTFILAAAISQRKSIGTCTERQVLILVHRTGAKKCQGKPNTRGQQTAED